MGENAFLLELERFLLARRCRHDRRAFGHTELPEEQTQR